MDFLTLNQEARYLIYLASAFYPRKHATEKSNNNSKFFNLIKAH